MAQMVKRLSTMRETRVLSLGWEDPLEKEMAIHSCVLCVLSCFSRVRLFATPWTIACQAPLFMGFSRQQHWSVLPFLSPGDLPDPGIKPVSLVSPALALACRFFYR